MSHDHPGRPPPSKNRPSVPLRSPTAPPAAPQYERAGKFRTAGPGSPAASGRPPPRPACHRYRPRRRTPLRPRSEEHTSELQSRRDLVCRLLLEKKKKKKSREKERKKKKKNQNKR